ncbi:putative acyl carrier protein [Ascodesmis nigricans]|uniref:Acyl carrier protein n=1 Tax=Ascodesmis nigricans TaxID=341454 RepID=A0A4S2N900_9PEZI|nr:putative acyl carrier protein [Ascodesmis nigricans]
MLFRSSLARAVARATVRPTIARPRVIIPTPAMTIAAPRLQMRFYSAPAGLTKDEVEGRIKDLLAGFDKVKDAASVTSTSHFTKDLNLDSLDTVEVVMAIEEEFSIEIPDKDADNIHSVDQAVNYILSQPDAH